SSRSGRSTRRAARRTISGSRRPCAEASTSAVPQGQAPGAATAPRQIASVAIAANVATTIWWRLTFTMGAPSPTAAVEPVDVELLAEPDVAGQDEDVVVLLPVEVRVVVERDVGEGDHVIVVAHVRVDVVADLGREDVQLVGLRARVDVEASGHPRAVEHDQV